MNTPPLTVFAPLAKNRLFLVKAWDKQVPSKDRLNSSLLNKQISKIGQCGVGAFERAQYMRALETYPTADV